MWGNRGNFAVEDKSKPLILAESEAPLLPKYSVQAVHLLRTVQNNTLLLSNMADNKASILMGATFVVFSIAVSQSMAGRLTWALGIMAVAAFASSLLAVMSVMPRIGRPSPNIVPNPLFFGHFAQQDEAEWTDDILERLKHDDSIYRAILHDIYQNGLVLDRRKYRFLAYSYRCFVVGLLVTLAAFGVELSLSG